MSTMLTTTSQYALRALTHLARQAGEPVLGRDLAQSGGIPKNYLQSDVDPANAGLSIRPWVGGGYRLGRSANEIYLIDVVELSKRFRTNPGCFLGHAKSVRILPCSAFQLARGTSCVLEISFPPRLGNCRKPVCLECFDRCCRRGKNANNDQTATHKVLIVE
jgi:hypothetical protein